MFGVIDVADAVTTRKDRFIKRYSSNSSVVCEMCAILVQFLSILFLHIMRYQIS